MDRMHYLTEFGPPLMSALAWSALCLSIFAFLYSLTRLRRALTESNPPVIQKFHDPKLENASRQSEGFDKYGKMDLFLGAKFYSLTQITSRADAETVARFWLLTTNKARLQSNHDLDTQELDLLTSLVLARSNLPFVYTDKADRQSLIRMFANLSVWQEASDLTRDIVLKDIEARIRFYETLLTR